jgi:hypothetical protein
MINFKQKELIETLTGQITEKFPEVEFLNVAESWEDPETLWIHVTAPEDEHRMTQLIEFAGDQTIDILTDYGYHMLVMPTGKLKEQQTPAEAA